MQLQRLIYYTEATYLLNITPVEIAKIWFFFSFKPLSGEVLQTPIDTVFTDKLNLSFFSLSNVQEKVKDRFAYRRFNMTVDSSQHKKVHLSHPFSCLMIKIGVNYIYLQEDRQGFVKWEQYIQVIQMLSMTVGDSKNSGAWSISNRDSWIHQSGGCAYSLLEHDLPFAAPQWRVCCKTSTRLRAIAQ